MPIEFRANWGLTVPVIMMRVKDFASVTETTCSVSQESGCVFERERERDSVS